jgi:hydroxymethylglutaryl-CoA lyase
MRKQRAKRSSKNVTIVEVGPRDGLQNEKTILSLETRLEFAVRLATAGIEKIEIGAFVSSHWVPQMAGSGDLIRSALALQLALQTKSDSGLQPSAGVVRAQFSALVPNPRGMEEAVAAGLKHVSVFASASETFSKKNINCSIEESFQRFAKVISLAKPHGVKVRGYLSMCFGCPFEGPVPEGQVVRLVKRLIDLGVYEVSIGDTIGVANPTQVRSLVRKLVDAVGEDRIAMHFHDTRGTALANVLASIDLGIRTFDSSLGGLGGCPYAPAATGNVATEDVVFMLHGMGFKTGIELEKLPELNKWITEKVGHELPSRVGRAGLPHLLKAD